MADDPTFGSPNKPNEEFWKQLRLPHYERKAGVVRNINEVQKDELSPLDKLAVVITDKVGSMGFFILIFVWTVIWCGYNLLASEVPSLHWKSFDPFPAFVAYLLISNVIQIWLMPLIMVGQNLQGRHSELRAQMDYETNQIAEKEVTVILRHLEHNTDLVLHLMKHLQCELSEEEQRALTAERQLAEKLVEIDCSIKSKEAALKTSP